MQSIFFFIFYLGLLAFPMQSFAALSTLHITEIFYDAEGADADREWIEIYNSGADAVIIPTGLSDESLRVYEEHGTTKHNHTLADAAYQGNLIIAAREFIVVAQDGAVFKSLFPSYAGTILISSAMSLGNTSQTIGLKIGANGAVWGGATYTSALGANGNGKSLQLQSGQWIAMMPAPGVSNISSSGTQNSGQEQQSAGGQNDSQDNSNELSRSLALAPIIPKFKVFAGEDQTAIAGAEVSFLGRALGFDDKLLGGGRFLWNFGDGSVAEGRSVSHIFNFPGVYIISLSVSSGYESASDYASVNIVPNPVFISEIKSGADGFIKITNNSKNILDIGSWIIRDETVKKEFIVPANTKIGSGTAVAFANIVTGLDKTGKGDEILLFYPNRLLAKSVVVSDTSANGDKMAVTETKNAKTEEISKASRESVFTDLPLPSSKLASSSGDNAGFSKNNNSVAEVYAMPGAGISSSALSFGAAILVSILAAIGFLVAKKMLFRM